MDETPSSEQTWTAESLPPNECWALLRGTELGRLALVVDGQPDIFPVSYVVDHGAVIFRTGPGRKLSAVNGQAGADLVAFEADGVSDGIAWSVVIKGRAREITGLYDALDSAQLALHPSQGGAKAHLVEVMPAEVTGRRFSIVDRAHWETPITGHRRAAPE